MAQQTEFVPYEQALELKELGFYYDVFAIYDIIDENHYKFLLEYKDGDNIFSYQIAAPLYQQAFRWFRNNHNILATVYSNASGYLFEWHDSIGGTHRGWSEYEGTNDGGVWDTYEEAELACLNRLIEIVKNK